MGRITIGNNVYIGANAIVTANTHITDNVIIGAGAVVTKSITQDGVYVGVPAQRICSYEEWKEKALRKAHNTYGMTLQERKDFFNGVLELP